MLMQEFAAYLGFLDENDSKFNFDKHKLNLLNKDEELNIMKKLSSYPDIIINSAKKFEPHLLTNYMKELAQEVHSYYNKYQVLVDDKDLRNARLSLMQATKHVFENSGKIVGITMPEKCSDARIKKNKYFNKGIFFIYNNFNYNFYIFLNQIKKKIQQNIFLIIC